MDMIALSNLIEERYRRYLKTTFYFKDPDFRASFEEALKSGYLAKGPYIEATPIFKRGQTPRTLFPSLLGFQPDNGFLGALYCDRPLYQHQELAIKEVFSQSNIVVATGTGSGKTEAFIYPILLHLYLESRARELGPGVRALILYPMNALANDQRQRLGEICKQLKEAKSPFRFTFGQYIGETPEDENDSRRHARDHLADRDKDGYSIVENGEVIHGELVLRSEMRKTPPHILLTNYSMLEYLLVRPDDSPLFDKGRAYWWTFIVLDEAHQYRGSRGIEMAMLLRRLKQRLIDGGRSQPFRCIATSATLIGEEGDRTAVAKFASDLFGEDFRQTNVILGETETIPKAGSQKLSLDDYDLLSESLQGQDSDTTNAIGKMAVKLGVTILHGEPPSKTAGRILQRDARATDLRRFVTTNPAEVKRVADRIFSDLPEHQRVSALSHLVTLLLEATDPVAETPLLSARYHLFLRSLEGSFVSYWPTKKVFLDRKANNQEQAAFEVALCRECGQHYLVGQIDRSGKLIEAIRDQSHPDFGATFFRPIENKGEDDIGDDDESTAKEKFLLCLKCSEITRDKLKCDHRNSIQLIKENAPADKDKADQMARCGACGYNAAGRDPVREVVYGADGPHAVIATTLYLNLPEKRKKVLAFADGRQEAAFFAWYLENSYRNILSRNLILKAAKKLSSFTSEGLSLRELATGLNALFRESSILPPAIGELQLHQEAWLRLYREFLTDEPRISLEGVGLIRWSLKWPNWFETSNMLTKSPWSLTKAEARDLVSILLGFMRTDGGVDLRTYDGVSINWSDLGVQTSQIRFRIGHPARPKGARYWPVRSWDSVDQWNHIRQTERTLLLSKLLGSSYSQEEALKLASEALREIWATFDRCEGHVVSKDRLLVCVDDGRIINPDWWRLHLTTKDDTIFQCDTCGRLQAISVRGICLRYRCSGTLKRIYAKDLESNHYGLLYEENLPGSLRVEEHTAQLDHEKAREFQQEFREGKIHVLSCSTTFELGVDLGDLDIIFLRNVPPEAFNYAQRVGRAGRRSGYPGFAITYCRRGPHDLYHFADPNRMLSGKVRPPALSLQNDKIITRHIAATALSHFFRTYPNKFESVQNLFEDLEHPSGSSSLRNFLSEHQVELEKCLHGIVPPDMITQLGLDDHRWATPIAGDESQFSLSEAEISSDFQTVKVLEATAAGKGDYDAAKWARARGNTISTESVLSFLSRKAVIPKYGFPVDVVELDTQRTQQNQDSFDVLLQRDLSIAISEFAPTSKLIANKKVWSSYGLKKVAEKEWPQKFYKRCRKHNVFLEWERGQPEPPTPCECGNRLTPFEYVIPRFGFVTDRNKPQEPTSRAAREFTTRPYFAGSTGPDRGIIDMPSKSPLISMKKASPGLMAVLCEGRRGEGFYICARCGAGFRKRERSHKTPQGQDCRGTLNQVSLGHEFVTDVLQLQFHSGPKANLEPISFAYSIAYALVEAAAEILEVPSTDLNAAVAHSAQYAVLPIILYDNVPGGAGLVARLEREPVFKSCLQSAVKRVGGNCGCDEDKSCYGCLRSYRNQFAHQFLQRGPVMHYLEEVVSRWK